MTNLFEPDKTSRRQYSQCTMACQSDQLSYIMGHYRKKFPVSSGCFFWQYNESFPTNSFSIIDYYSMPKMCYYSLARANEPVILFAEDDSWLLKDGKVKSSLYLVSDSAGFTNATAAFILLDTTGKVLLEKSFRGDFTAGSTLLGEIDAELDSIPADGMAIGRTILTDENGRRVYCNERIYGVTDFTKAFQLEQAELSVEKSIVRQNGETLLTVKVSNKGKIAAVNVRTHLSDVDFTQVYWQQNYQHIMPGESVTFTAAITGVFENAPAVQVYAWNYPEKIF
jgi:beta-mannosidase